MPPAPKRKAAGPHRGSFADSPRKGADKSLSWSDYCPWSWESLALRKGDRNLPSSSFILAAVPGERKSNEISSRPRRPRTYWPQWLEQPGGTMQDNPLRVATEEADIPPPVGGSLPGDF